MLCLKPTCLHVDSIYIYIYIGILPPPVTVIIPNVVFLHHRKGHQKFSLIFSTFNRFFAHIKCAPKKPVHIFIRLCQTSAYYTQLLPSILIAAYIKVHRPEFAAVLIHYFVILMHGFGYVGTIV